MPSIGTNSKPAYVYDAGTDTWIPIGPGEHTHDYAASAHNHDSAYIAKTLTTTTGDIIYASAANTPARLGIGSTDQVLKVSGGLPVWGTLSSAPTFVGCYLYNSAAQSVDNAANFVLTFNSESFDTDAFHSTSTNTSRITIPSGKGGKYLFSGSIVFASNSTGRRALKFVKNATTYFEMIEINASSGETAITASLIVDLVATDYMEMIAGQTSGGGLNANGGVATTKFQAVYLGA